MFSDVLSCSLMFSHVLSCSLMFSHVLSCSLMFSQALSCSLMFSHVLSCSYMLSLFSHVLTSPFHTHVCQRSLMFSIFSHVFSHQVSVMFVLSRVMLWKCGISFFYVCGHLSKLSKRIPHFIWQKLDCKSCLHIPLLNSKSALD
jgi:hypothetical protein